MSDTPLPRILIVDDEQPLLEGLSLHLRRHFDVTTATSGTAALEHLRSGTQFAVVMSDMRMPGMDGATFLAHVHQGWPDTVRVLLTGHADLDVAIAAVNEGRLFRFLTKPCAPPKLVAALQAAAEQHHIVLAERVLLEETLLGSIRALTDVLAVVQPLAFGRAQRLKRHASAIAAHFGKKNDWELEAAALLSQIGCVSLPTATLERFYDGADLTDSERVMVGRMPDTVARLLGNIPRLDGVRALLTLMSRDYAAETPPRLDAIPWGARVLKVVHEFDKLETSGLPPAHAVEILRTRAGQCDPAVLDALGSLVAGAAVKTVVRELSLRELKQGMVLAAELRLRSGTLLVSRGYEITQGLLERLRNFPSGHVREPIRVVVRMAEWGEQKSA